MGLKGYGRTASQIEKFAAQRSGAIDTEGVSWGDTARRQSRIHYATQFEKVFT